MSTNEPTVASETRKCTGDLHVGELHEKCECGEMFFARSGPYRLKPAEPRESPCEWKVGDEAILTRSTDNKQVRARIISPFDDGKAWWLQGPTMRYVRSSAELQPVPPAPEQAGSSFTISTRTGVGIVSCNRACPGPGICSVCTPVAQPEPAASEPTHVYLSTYCFHMNHAACRLTCKTCKASCVCTCHKGRTYVSDVSDTDPFAELDAAIGDMEQWALAICELGPLPLRVKNVRAELDRLRVQRMDTGPEGMEPACQYRATEPEPSAQAAEGASECAHLGAFVLPGADWMHKCPQCHGVFNADAMEIARLRAAARFNEKRLTFLRETISEYVSVLATRDAEIATLKAAKEQAERERDMLRDAVERSNVALQRSNEAILTQAADVVARDLTLREIAGIAEELRARGSNPFLSAQTNGNAMEEFADRIIALATSATKPA